MWVVVVGWWKEKKELERGQKSYRMGAVSTSATTATDASVVASLPAASPVSGGNFWVTTAQEKALGLTAANGTSVDGSVGFGLASLFTYGDTATSGTGWPAAHSDFFATVVHELTEVMGRQLLTGATEGTLTKSYTLLDLLHYSAAGTRDFTASKAGYFSPDVGVTNLNDFNTSSGGDAGDWASSVTADPFDAFASSGVFEPVSANDLTTFDAIGWRPSGSGMTVQLPPAPTGVSATPVKTSLASAQVNKGLAGKAALATFSQTGGPAGDSYSYTLGGAGAGSFTLASASNGATLSVGTTALMASKTAGALYALTVTATRRDHRAVVAGRSVQSGRWEQRQRYHPSFVAAGHRGGGSDIRLRARRDRHHRRHRHDRRALFR